MQDRARWSWWYDRRRTHSAASGTTRGTPRGPVSDPDPLASFEPQLIDGRLQLTVRHVSTVALYAGLAAFYAIGFGGGFLWNARDLLEQGRAEEGNLRNS